MNNPAGGTTRDSGKLYLIQIIRRTACLFLAGIAVLWAISGCLDYFVNEAPLWRLIIGLFIIFLVCILAEYVLQEFDS